MTDTRTPHDAHDPAAYDADFDPFCPDCEAWQYDQIVSPAFRAGIERIAARSSR